MEEPLKLALPRGALFAETLDVLDAVGVDTSGPRGDSRALIFHTPDLTLVTMRPSDVPTYVEAGSADLGITGKDVLAEQRDRAVYELLDLGYGRCRMVLAGRRGDASLGESARRLGAMRIATKYPRIAERYFEETGRQVEIIEVKGSVELAPLVGLADGIVDLVDTGRTLEENQLEVREEIAPSSARLVANRVAHKLRAAEVRANDRKLLFADAGIVTMRPSDVPIYVEAGAADVGITGKDVLAEHPERDVYELLDLGFGPCRMVFATVAGEDRAAEALRRLGVMRVATKYPRIAGAYFERTGRQAEIVEVKGSVELAPLTGMVHGIVDLTATGTTLRENGLVIREEISPSTARLIANPVSYRVKAAEIDAVVERLRAG